jgi:dipeptidase D
MTEHNANVIKELKPERVWHHFSEIASRPHPSMKEGKVRDYLIDFAKKHNLEWKTDKIGNVVIYKPAQNTSSDKTTILQSHIDMVCESNPNVSIDFNNDPIALKKEGDLIKASGTTLGADNGIGVAVMLAILEDKSISHPKLQALFTIDEETGMTGAKNYDKSLLDAEYMVNLDTEDEGYVFIGSAGGGTIKAKYNAERENTSHDSAYLSIVVDGLRGGHSGLDINKNYANAIKIIAVLMAELTKNELFFNISYIEGGRMMNAIPRYAEVSIAINKDEKEQAKSILKTLSEKIIKRYKDTTEPNISITIETENKGDGKAFSKDFSRRFIDILNAIHSGVFKMSVDVENMVQTSNNLGVVNQECDSISLVTLTRSDNMLEIEFAMSQILSAINIIEPIELVSDDKFPGWTPLPIVKNSLLQIFLEVHKETTGKDAEVVAVHAGLECGFFAGVMPDTKIISIGPEINNAHSPDEEVSIGSTERFYKLVLELLKKL